MCRIMNSDRPRILIVDDNPQIHSDFRKVLLGDETSAELTEMESSLFGGDAGDNASPQYEIDSAFQGQQAIDMVQQAKRLNRAYGLAFVDVRMPPGMDGVETIRELRKVAPEMNFVICTAYSDYTPAAARQKVGLEQGLLFLAKPFDVDVVRQLAQSLCATAT